MSEPRTEFLRRWQVMDWLTDENGVGLTKSYVRVLIEQKVIVGAPLPGRKPGRKTRAGHQKNGNGKHKGRQKGQLVFYYRKSQIKKELGL